jgi:HAD superfamily hydrolase (TIGR01509 family)
LYADEVCDLVASAREGLSTLGARGVATGLVTSGSRDRVTRELLRLGLERAFSVVVCSEDVRAKKPHPEALHRALGLLGVSAASAAYVGDSPEDVEMARAAGVYSVGVAGAFPNREALTKAKPDLLAESLLDAVRTLLRSRPA